MLVESGDHAIDVVSFQRAVTKWGQDHFRPFPWRLNDDPYWVLMAEVMLHRTQALQVAPVYERFIQSYPDLFTLAKATRKDLHSALYSLGLRWRTDLIYEMVTELMARFNGQIPEEKADLLSLPGVSDYVASATRCFVWNYPEPLVDTNTVRIVGRLYGLAVKDSSRRNRRFRELITALVEQEDPRAYNYALLDLADQICIKKGQPECQGCPAKQCCATGHTTIA